MGRRGPGTGREGSCLEQQGLRQHSAHRPAWLHGSASTGEAREDSSPTRPWDASGGRNKSPRSPRVCSQLSAQHCFSSGSPPQVLLQSSPQCSHGCSSCCNRCASKQRRCSGRNSLAVWGKKFISTASHPLDIFMLCVSKSAVQLLWVARRVLSSSQGEEKKESGQTIPGTGSAAPQAQGAEPSSR